MSAASFVPRLWTATEGQGLFAPSREILVAQGGLESGWGGAIACRLGNNPFNLTRTSSDPRPVIKGPDRDGHGNLITQRFRAYMSLAGAVEDYLEDFLPNFRRYSSGKLPDRSALEALLLGDAAQFVILLKEGGFFEAPLSEYQAGMAASLATVRRLLAPTVVA